MFEVMSERVTEIAECTIMNDDSKPFSFSTIQHGTNVHESAREEIVPNPPCGISHFLSSAIGHLPLHRPVQCLWLSTEICCCPLVLLSKRSRRYSVYVRSDQHSLYILEAIGWAAVRRALCHIRLDLF